MIYFHSLHSSVKVNVSDSLQYWIVSTDTFLITINAVLAIVTERKFSLNSKKYMLFQKICQESKVQEKQFNLVKGIL